MYDWAEVPDSSGRVEGDEIHKALYLTVRVTGETAFSSSKLYEDTDVPIIQEAETFPVGRL